MPQESVATLLSQADLLQQKSQFTEAIAQYRRAIELNPRFSWSYHYLGEALTTQNDWEGAIAAYRHAIELNPNSTYSYHKLGQVLTHVGQWQEAALGWRFPWPTWRPCFVDRSSSPGPGNHRRSSGYRKIE